MQIDRRNKSAQKFQTSNTWQDKAIMRSFYTHRPKNTKLSKPLIILNQWN
jgi:hypothetical protein